MDSVRTASVVNRYLDLLLVLTETLISQSIAIFLLVKLVLT